MIEKSEGHSRRRNVICNGKPEADKENTEEVVRKFLVDDLKMDNTEVQNMMFRDVHRLPKSKKNPAGARPIIMAFILQKDRNAVMRKD